LSDQVVIALIGATSTLIVAVVSHFGRKLGKAVEGTHRRIDRLEGRIDGLADRMERRIDSLINTQVRVHERLGRLEGRGKIEASSSLTEGGP
jgi:hypothetical protein